ncbi:ferredoxin, 2Fe-2S [Sphingopyxis flava]|uniref:Ferredoxin, 2Fe-2S n=2 Tax=Sphingopyxis flava TaxID=1507287 RepID=A0A1T5E602_9SPHN|nr:ferredoxin, 2Fe-2S [Sphingopyxis flava]
MLAARAADVPGIIGECGGSMNCLTCHCYVAPADIARIGPPTQIESDLLDGVIEARENSRLTCQIVVRADLDGVTFSVPQWQG